MGRWYLLLAAVLRAVTFGRVGVEGRRPAPPRGARIVVASHRNGAVDGYPVLAAFPRVQALVSIQLLRNPLLRMMFTGIPVVRTKDVERYGLDRSAVADPVEAGCAHLRAGGELLIFPEGTGRFGHAPQPYQRGAAHMAARLMEEGIPVEVIPVGLFYSAPDRFRSRAHLMIGEAVDLPPRGEEPAAAWRSTIVERIGAGLDAVSVNCPDEPTFERIQQAARADAQRGRDFGTAFLQRQRVWPAVADEHAPSEGGVVRALGLLLMWLAWPVLAAGWLAGTRADARHTVTFFRTIGGLAVGVVWLCAVVLAAFFWPVVIMMGALCAALGWFVLGIPRWRV